MVVMTVPDFWSGQDRMLTVEDMENMADDEFRYELDDGVLIVSRLRPRLHQLAVARLTVDPQRGMSGRVCRARPASASTSASSSTGCRTWP